MIKEKFKIGNDMYIYYERRNEGKLAKYMPCHFYEIIVDWTTKESVHQLIAELKVKAEMGKHG